MIKFERVKGVPCRTLDASLESQFLRLQIYAFFLNHSRLRCGQVEEAPCTYPHFCKKEVVLQADFVTFLIRFMNLHAVANDLHAVANDGHAVANDGHAVASFLHAGKSFFPKELLFFSWESLVCALRRKCFRLKT
ncbi:MAG: hypothetical protein ACI3YC_03320 [Alloprevotella sp.]